MSAKRRRTRQRRLLRTLPGVGRDRAERLLKHYGTVRACSGASRAELEGVEGIGPKTMEAIIGVVNEERGAYGDGGFPDDVSGLF